MLVIGIVSTLAVGLVIAARSGACFGCERVDVLGGLRAELVLNVFAVGLAIGGLVWMIRSFRGDRADPPAWRYRER